MNMDRRVRFTTWECLQRSRVTLQKQSGFMSRQKPSLPASTTIIIWG